MDTEIRNAMKIDGDKLARWLLYFRFKEILNKEAFLNLNLELTESVVSLDILTKILFFQLQTTDFRIL